MQLIKFAITSCFQLKVKAGCQTGRPNQIILKPKQMKVKIKHMQLKILLKSFVNYSLKLQSLKCGSGKA
jgi:hypothetical protein